MARRWTRAINECNEMPLFYSDCQLAVTVRDAHQSCQATPTALPGFKVDGILASAFRRPTAKRQTDKQTA